jgi:hypothetical protein
MLYVVFAVAVTTVTLVWIKVRRSTYEPVDWHRYRRWMDGE